MEAVWRVDASADAARGSADRAHGLGIWRTLVLLLCIGAIVAVPGVLRLQALSLATPGPPPVRPLDPLRSLEDLRPVAITTTTAEWTKESAVVPFDRLRTDRQLWRQMHFGDWDIVPAEFREPSLLAMVRAFAPVLREAAAWQRMTPDDWDLVPQPIRATAFLRMIWHWSRIEAVGVEFGLSPDGVAHSIGAVVMAESWFEHRAYNENPWGNRDLGLAQCSDYCRKEIAAMAEAGELPFPAPSDEAYFNPWVATRVATVWFERELANAAGDVELAIRAYHRGIQNALDERGDVYLANVLRLRRDYVRTQAASPAWAFLTAAVRAL